MTRLEVAGMTRFEVAGMTRFEVAGTRFEAAGMTAKQNSSCHIFRFGHRYTTCPRDLL